MTKKKETLTEALAPTGPTDMSTEVVQLDGMDDMTGDELIPPRFKIRQPTSPAVAREGMKAGVFASEMTGEEHESMRIVVLRISKSRSYFEDKDSKAPECSSKDALAPSPFHEDPLSDQCAYIDKGGRMQTLCPQALWGDDGKPPKCQLGYDVIALHPESGLVFFIRLSGTSFKPTKQLRSYFWFSKRPPYTVAVDMSTSMCTQGDNTWYKVAFSGHEKLADPEQYRGYYEQFGGYSVDKILDAEERAAEGDDDKVMF